MDFKTFLNNTISRISHAAAQRTKPSAAYNEQRTKREDVRSRTISELREDKALNRSQRRAKYSHSRRGKPFRRVAKFERHGPFFRPAQAGGLNRQGEPLLEQFYEYRVLHATKGWRVYTNRVPNAVA